MDIEIRPMREDDLPRIMEIEHESYSTPWPERSFEGLLKRPNATLLVAVTDGEVIGYAVSWTVLDEAELGNIAVAPASRRHGVAQELLTATIEEMDRKNAASIYLEVRVTNELAQRLYTRNGFEPVGERKDYYSEPTEDALVMRRRSDVSDRDRHTRRS